MRSKNVALFFLLTCAASLASSDPAKLGVVIGIDLGTTYSWVRRCLFSSSFCSVPPLSHVMIWEIAAFQHNSCVYSLSLSQVCGCLQEWKGRDHRQRPGKPYYTLICGIHRHRAPHRRCRKKPGHCQSSTNCLRRQASDWPQVSCDLLIRCYGVRCLWSQLDYSQLEAVSAMNLSVKWGTIIYLCRMTHFPASSSIPSCTWAMYVSAWLWPE